MATTTNYGWGTPDDTDLVKDGALAIRDLGQDIDTTTKALNPETTTGDIAYRSATANTNTRLAIGTAGQVLTVNSGATAPEWATPAATTPGLVLIGTPTTFTSSSAVNINDVFSSTYDNYRVVANFTSTPSTDLLFRYRVSGADDTTSNYYLQGQDVNGSSTNSFRLTAEDKGRFGTSSSTESSFVVDMFSPFLGFKKRAQSVAQRGSIVLPEIAFFWNTFNATTSFTGFTVYPNTSTISGTIAVYGYTK